MWGRRALCACLVVAALLTGVTPGSTRDLAPRPNVLVVMSDDQAWSNFSPTLMPRVFSDIVDEGLLFTRAYASSPVCCPSRSETFTGLWEHHTGVDGNGYALTRPTIPMALHDSGYRTMLAGKYLNSWTDCAPRPEFDRWSCVGTPEPSSYTQVDPWMNVDGVMTHFTGYQTDILAQQVVDFVATTPVDQPFFALYAPTTPHSPADDPRYAAMPVTPPRPPNFDAETRTADTPKHARHFPLGAGTIAATDRHFRNAARSVRALDDAVGTLLDGLGDRADDTLVIYVSDNGYQFGEHRRIGKFDAYEESVRVPMAMRYPALRPVNAAATTEELAANVDLAPTVAELTGIEWHADGVSLVPLLRGVHGPVRDAVLLERCQGEHLLKDRCNGLTFFGVVAYPGAFVGLVTSRFKYVEYADGVVQLFDLVIDPYELTNLAGSADLAVVQEQLAGTTAQLRGPPAADTTVVTGPTGTVRDRSVAFTFFSQSRFSTYRCRLLRAGVADPWHDCSSGTDVVGGLADGDYVFEVAGTDEHGNEDPTPATRPFGVETVGGPDVTISSGPAPAQRERTADFRFESSVAGATFECRLQEWGTRQGWTPCDAATGATYADVPDGTWNFEVRAIDPLTGERSVPPATQVLRVDNQGPRFQVWTRPPDVSSDATATFGFSPLEATQGPYTCSVDAAPAVDCSSGAATFTGLAEGLHSLAVKGKDLLGTGRTTFVTWRIDLTAPAVTLGTRPSAWWKGAFATFELSTDEPPGLFACKVDAYPEIPCSASWTVGPFDDGSHTLIVRAVDPAGRRSAPVNWTWTVDTVRPVVTITGGPPQGSTTVSTTPSFRFTVSEPATTRCSLDGGPFRVCTSPKPYSAIAPGSHTFRVYGVDPAGNRSVTRTRSWTVAG